jgi:hypothetical protein
MITLPAHSDDEMNAAFVPYIVGLGKVAHAWNHLHEELAKVFCLVAELEFGMGLAIWHSLPSDRMQREILKAALKASSSDSDWVEKYPRAEGDIGWLLKKTKDLSERRNDAIHGPCSLGVVGGRLEIIPAAFFGNKIAKRLREKDVVNEFSWYHKSAATLQIYAREIQSALMDQSGNRPWPKRPEMPNPQGTHRTSERKTTEPRVMRCVDRP